MRKQFTPALHLYTAMPKPHRLMLVTLLPLLLVIVIVTSLLDLKPQSIVLPKLIDAEVPTVDAAQKEDIRLPDLPSYEYIIRKGDTLSSIFERVNQPLVTMYQVLESDASVLALDTLKPGDTLRFWVNSSDNSLQKLELKFSLAHQVVFTRVDEEGFEYEEVLLPGEWREERVAGDINGSFYVSAKKAGLTAVDIQKIYSLLKERINFNKQLRAGDSFQVIRARQYVKGEFTGESKIEGIRILNRKRELTAFLFDDNYFDKDGRSLARAFQRIPLKRRYRISSSFNPRRRHPVTRLIRPHNGTDFATPIGTPVYATGDGIVKRVVRHRYAGLYITIQHGPKYKTRFLHLKKSYVRKGQAVTRGQKIALSGNSGRSTGAHLHFEFHINNRPVNAMKAKIPEAASIAKKQRKAFKSQVDRIMSEMLSSR